MASKTEVARPLKHVNTYAVLYLIHGTWYIRFYVDLPTAIAEKERILHAHRGKYPKPQVHIAWILI